MHFSSHGTEILTSAFFAVCIENCLGNIFISWNDSASFIDTVLCHAPDLKVLASLERECISTEVNEVCINNPNSTRNKSPSHRGTTGDSLGFFETLGECLVTCSSQQCPAKLSGTLLVFKYELICRHQLSQCLLGITDISLLRQLSHANLPHFVHFTPS